MVAVVLWNSDDVGRPEGGGAGQGGLNPNTWDLEIKVSRSRERARARDPAVRGLTRNCGDTWPFDNAQTQIFRDTLEHSRKLKGDPSDGTDLIESASNCEFSFLGTRPGNDGRLRAREGFRVPRVSPSVVYPNGPNFLPRVLSTQHPASVAYRGEGRSRIDRANADD